MAGRQWDAPVMGASNLKQPLQIRFGDGVFGLVLFVLASQPAIASDEAEVEESVPSIEFLEFLGSFETDEGDWINPGDLISSDFGFLLDNASIDREIDPNEKDSLEIPDGSPDEIPDTK